MKKNLCLIVVMLLCCVCGTAFAAGEWVEFDLSAVEGTPMECEILPANLENEQVKAVLGEITENDWAIGPEDAVLTILEYADFQCPYCSYAGIQLLNIQAAHPDKIRYVYRHFPLNFHEKAPMAAYAADAAGQQGFFFDAEHYLYSTQNDWSGLESLEAFDAWLRENFTANIEGLDVDAWTEAYESEEVRANVDSKFNEVASTGLVQGTPTVFFNFEQAPNGYGESEVMKFVSLFEHQANLKDSCPLMVTDSDHDYRAVLQTADGDITIDLFAEDAPLAVNNLINLAADGYYDGVTFHRVVPGFVIQTGDPSATGYGNPGYQFADELNEHSAYGKFGMVGMANSGAGTNGSQFFITYSLADYFMEAYGQDESLSEEEAAAKTAQTLEMFTESYTLFGEMTEDSEEAFNAVEQGTVIEKVTILTREK